MDDTDYKILEVLDKEPTHFRALKKKCGLTDQQTSKHLKDLFADGLVTRTISGVSASKLLGRKNPYVITQKGINILRDHVALERYRGALENISNRFEALWTPAAQREADGMHVLFTSLVVDIIGVLFEADKAKSLPEAERYVKAKLAGLVSDIILDYTRMCYMRKDLDLGGLPLLGYVHDSYLAYRDRELSDWIQKYAANWHLTKKDVELVPGVELVHALMVTKGASIDSETLLNWETYAKHGSVEFVEVKLANGERRRMLLTNKALANKLKRHAPLTGKPLIVVGHGKKKGKKYSDFYVEEEEQAKRDGFAAPTKK